MSDESSLWKNPGWAKPKRKMDWAKARQRQAEEKEALKERLKAMKRETEERNPQWFKRDAWARRAHPARGPLLAEGPRRYAARAAAIAATE